MNNLATGVRYLVTGFELIFKPGLRRFVLLPILINTLLFLSLFFLFKHYVNEFNVWVMGFLPTWLQWLGIFIWLLFIISYVLIFIFTFVTFANIISAPFNSFLAEKVELYLTGSMPASKSLMDNLKDTPRIIGRQLAILGFYLPRACLLLILFFVPVIQLGAAFFWFLFNAWFMTLSFVDYPTDNHRIPLKDVRAWLAERRWVTIGLGSSILLCSMIPILNIFVIPASVAAATNFWLQEREK